MRVSIVRRISIASILSRRRYRLRNDDRHNQSVNTQDTRHDNGNNSFNDTGWVIDTHLAYTETGPPGTPGRAPTAENHAGGGAHVAAVEKKRIEVRK